MKFNKEFDLPLIDKRTYVHSTTFLKHILQQVDCINSLIIKFKKVSKTTKYRLLIQSTDGNEVPDVEGNFTLINGSSYTFAYLPLQASSIQKDQQPSVNISKISSISELIDGMITHSKALCDGLYDSRNNMLYMAKIELANLCALDFPLSLEYLLKQSGSRFVVTYTWENLQIANLLGLTKNVRQCLE